MQKKAVTLILTASVLSLLVLLSTAFAFFRREPEIIVSDMISEPEAQAQSLDEISSSEEERERVTLEFPYYIKVDKGAQIVTIYTTDSEGKYRKVVREMAASTGVKDYKLPDGFYRVKETKMPWGTLMAAERPQTYGQYLTKIHGHIFFHSIPYRSNAPSSLNAKEYNRLGTPVSGGCVRLTVENAKWIYDNIKPGTTIEVCTGPARPDDLAKLLPPKLDPMAKWDPSDPHPYNPDYKTMYPDAENEPQPDPYAELYPYDFKYNDEVSSKPLMTAPETSSSEESLP